MPKIKNFFSGLHSLHQKLKKNFKANSFFILKLVYGSKKQINIGSLYKVNLDSRYIFLVGNWGTKHKMDLKP